MGLHDRQAAAIARGEVRIRHRAGATDHDMDNVVRLHLEAAMGSAEVLPRLMASVWTTWR
jgi:hypothetical protein